MKFEYEDYVKKNGINNVIFEGHKSGEELEKLFRNALFLVSPSEWYENAPMTLLESFAYGKLVIGAEIGGIPEMIIDNESGLLFKPGDYQQLKEKIKYLLSAPSVVAAMGKKARERVEKEYNIQLHYKRLMDVYQKAQTGT
jgi:glycosyltransferase involved in cell wall biosynthesis